MGMVAQCEEDASLHDASSVCPTLSFMPSIAYMVLHDDEGVSGTVICSAQEEPTGREECHTQPMPA